MCEFNGLSEGLQEIDPADLDAILHDAHASNSNHNLDSISLTSDSSEEDNLNVLPEQIVNETVAALEEGMIDLDKITCDNSLSSNGEEQNCLENVDNGNAKSEANYAFSNGILSLELNANSNPFKTSRSKSRSCTSNAIPEASEKDGCQPPEIIDSLIARMDSTSNVSPDSGIQSVTGSPSLGDSPSHNGSHDPPACLTDEPMGCPSPPPPTLEPEVPLHLLQSRKNGAMSYCEFLNIRKRGRGRPREKPPVLVPKEKRKPGRPKGSLNKSKERHRTISQQTISRCYVKTTQKENAVPDSSSLPKIDGPIEPISLQKKRGRPKKNPPLLEAVFGAMPSTTIELSYHTSELLNLPFPPPDDKSSRRSAVSKTDDSELDFLVRSIHDSISTQFTQSENDDLDVFGSDYILPYDPVPVFKSSKAVHRSKPGKSSDNKRHQKTKFLEMLDNQTLSKSVDYSIGALSSHIHPPPQPMCIDVNEIENDGLNALCYKMDLGSAGHSNNYNSMLSPSSTVSFPSQILKNKKVKLKSLLRCRSKHKNIVDPVFLADVEDLIKSMKTFSLSRVSPVPTLRTCEVKLPSIFVIKRIARKRKVSEKTVMTKKCDKELSGSEADGTLGGGGAKEKARRRTKRSTSTANPPNEEKAKTSNKTISGTDEQRLPLKKRHRHLSASAMNDAGIQKTSEEAARVVQANAAAVQSVLTDAMQRRTSIDDAIDAIVSRYSLRRNLELPKDKDLPLPPASTVSKGSPLTPKKRHLVMQSMNAKVEVEKKAAEVKSTRDAEPSKSFTTRSGKIVKSQDSKKNKVMKGTNIRIKKLSAREILIKKKCDVLKAKARRRRSQNRTGFDRPKRRKPKCKSPSAEVTVGASIDATVHKVDGVEKASKMDLGSVMGATRLRTLRSRQLDDSKSDNNRTNYAVKRKENGSLPEVMPIKRLKIKATAKSRRKKEAEDRDHSDSSDSEGFVLISV